MFGSIVLMDFLFVTVVRTAFLYPFCARLYSSKNTICVGFFLLLVNIFSFEFLLQYLEFEFLLCIPVIVTLFCYCLFNV